MRPFVPALIALFALPLFAGEQRRDLRDLTLEELLETKVSVATHLEMTARESPSIVTVITRQEIEASGARDLREVLTQFVPGVHFATDVEGFVGIGMRGIWASEGKMLLLIDGIEANEGLFGTSGYHYPAETIERVEVIRGPGSAVYGGYAAVGVVNVISRSGERYVTGTWSQMEKSYSKRGLAFGLSGALGSLNGSWFQGMRSDRDNVDYFGGRRSLAGDSRLDDLNLNLHLQRGGFDLRGVLDHLDTTEFTLFGRNHPGPALDEDFHWAAIRIRYTYALSPELKVTPRLEYSRQAPWQLDVPSESYSNRKHVEKPLAGVLLEWHPRAEVSAIAGIERYRNDVVMPAHPGPFEERLQSGGNRLRVESTGVFAQLARQWQHAELTVGGRYEDTDAFGSAFVPRVAIVGRFDRLHLKGMAARSFRVPGGILPNRIPPGAARLEPEQATSYEVEAGYQFTDRSLLTMNLFDVSFDKEIVYEANPATGVGSYINSGRLGSRGVEADYRYVGPVTSVTANLAWYRADENDVAIYSVPGHRDRFLGFPPLRINLLGGIRLTQSVSVHPSLSYFGSRFAFAEGDTLRELGGTALVNLNVRLRNIGSGNVVLDAGVRNVTNANVPFIQPYHGYVAPLPSESRALVVSAMWGF